MQKFSLVSKAKVNYSFKVTYVGLGRLQFRKYTDGRMLGVNELRRGASTPKAGIVLQRYITSAGIHCGRVRDNIDGADMGISVESNSPNLAIASPSSDVPDFILPEKNIRGHQNACGGRDLPAFRGWSGEGRRTGHMNDLILSCSRLTMSNAAEMGLIQAGSIMR